MIDLLLGTDGMPLGVPSDYNIPTLAYDALDWAEEYLVQPDGDFLGDPWEWTDTQARVLQWWFAIDRDSRRWMYRRGQIVLPKGAGKSPLAGALSCMALAAPVVFDGFDAYGEAVGRPQPSPHIQLCGVSESQTENTMSLVRAMLENDKAYDEIAGLDVGITKITTAFGKLEPVAASAASREGQRLSDAILDEPHLWLPNNGGQRLAAVIRRNLGKMNGRSMETTNAWIPGEDSVAQRTYEYAMKMAEGRTRDKGVLRYHPSEHVDDLSNEADVRDALERLYSDSPWIDIDRLIEEIYDLDTHPSDARRFYLNEVNSANDAWLTEPELAIGSEPLNVISPDDPIVLGFDGSKRRSRGVADATALIGCRVTDGHIFVLRVWEQPENQEEWEVPKSEVDAEIASVMKDYNVVGFYADPAKWESYVAKWEALYGEKMQVKASGTHPIEWWMTGGRSGLIVKALDSFYTALLDRRMTHDNSGVFVRHALNARRRVTRSGIQIAKENPDSPRKIDAVVAAVLAYQCRLDAMAQGVVANHNNQRSKAIRRR